MNLPPAYICAVVLRRRRPARRLEQPRVAIAEPKPLSLHLEVLREFAEAQHRHR